MQQVEIRVKGQLDRNWSAWLGGLNINHTGSGDTVLKGTLRDQSALYGLLNSLSNLGLVLLSINTPGSRKKKLRRSYVIEKQDRLKKQREI